MLAAIVDSRRSSASLKAPGWVFSRSMTPRTRSLAMIGTPSHDADSLPPT